MIARRLAPQFCVLTFSIAALAPACNRAPPERQLVDEALAALGGRGAVEAASALVIEGEGESFVPGQGRSLDAVLTYKVTAFKRATDFAGGRWRQEQVLTPRFLKNDPRPTKDITALDGSIAFDVDEDGSASRALDPIARDRRAELWHSPLGALRAAIAPGASLSGRRRESGHEAIDVRTAAGESFTLAIDGTTKLPVRVSSTTDHTNLGDVVVETEFGDYRPAGPLKLPTLITSKLDRTPLFAIRVSKNVVNGPAGDLAAPAAVRAAPSTPPPPSVRVDALAPGVWLLGGQSAHSVLVEFADHLTLIEAPTDDARTLAVVAKARELVPSKPLTEVVSTHHHFDHTGGVRAAISEGLMLIVHERSKPFFEALASRSHALAPDALAKKPRPLKLRAVSGRATLEDSTRKLELYAVDSPHADTMLVAYLPGEKLLVEVDLYTAPPPDAPPLQYPHVPSLLGVVATQNLNVDRVVPLHRGVVPFADLVAAGRQTPPPTAP